MHWRRKWQPTPVFLPGESQGQRSLVGCRLWGHTESDMTEVTQQQQQQLSCWLNDKESTCNAGDPGSILGQKDALERGMATHSSIAFWRISWTEEPVGSPWGHKDWATSTLNYTLFLPRWFSGKEFTCRAGDLGLIPGREDPLEKHPWRRRKQPIPVFLMGKSHGQRSLVGYSPWDCKERGTTERLSMHPHIVLCKWILLDFDKLCLGKWIFLFLGNPQLWMSITYSQIVQKKDNWVWRREKKGREIHQICIPLSGISVDLGYGHLSKL